MQNNPENSYRQKHTKQSSEPIETKTTKQSSEHIETKTHKAILRTHRDKNTQSNPQNP
jgi:hypothetical protein